MRYFDATEERTNPRRGTSCDLSAVAERKRERERERERERGREREFSGNKSAASDFGESHPTKKLRGCGPSPHGIPRDIPLGEVKPVEKNR